MAARELDRTPSMLPLFARAGAAMIPLASRLPFVSGGGREIPDLELSLRDVEIDRERLAAYCRVCGFSLGDSLPATYPQMLAFPLHLSLMTDGSFPFPAIGLVHISNQIIQHRPISASEKLSIRVKATKLEPHPSGRQFSLRSEARVGDELVWEEVSTNLKRGGGSGDSSGGGSGRSSGGRARRQTGGELSPTATWHLEGDLGRRYGAVSGDLNPIHMHPLSAKLFGFPGAIAHGMWTKARCLAALEGRLPKAFTVEVAFRKPIVLPATVQFAQDASDRGIRFAVRDEAKGTAHLDGELDFAWASSFAFIDSRARLSVPMDCQWLGPRLLRTLRIKPLAWARAVTIGPERWCA
jgi:acyl dehydratase